jgi:nicotinate-nucleotide adenylyltransferase
MWCEARARPGPPEHDRSALRVTSKTSKTSSKSRLLRLPMAQAGMAVGLLGGSFNPPHDGHLAISLHALARLRLDRLWWLVTPGNPLKSKHDLAALGDRLTQANALARDPRIEVTGFEEGLSDAYTRNTLRYLQQRRHGVNFVWLMGADNLKEFHNWRDWREIFQLMPVAVLDRPGHRLAGLSSPAAHAFARYRIDESDAAGLARLAPPAWTFLTTPLSSSSSTAIRRGERD